LQPLALTNPHWVRAFSLCVIHKEDLWPNSWSLLGWWWWWWWWWWWMQWPYWKLNCVPFIYLLYLLNDQQYRINKLWIINYYNLPSYSYLNIWLFKSDWRQSSSPTCLSTLIHFVFGKIYGYNNQQCKRQK
jgi:hypothetical protein